MYIFIILELFLVCTLLAEIWTRTFIFVSWVCFSDIWALWSENRQYVQDVKCKFHASCFLKLEKLFFTSIRRINVVYPSINQSTQPAAHPFFMHLSPWDWPSSWASCWMTDVCIDSEGIRKVANCKAELTVGGIKKTGRMKG